MILPKIKYKKTYWVDVHRGGTFGLFFAALREEQQRSVCDPLKETFVKTISFEVDEEREVTVGDSFEVNLYPEGLSALASEDDPYTKFTEVFDLNCEPRAVTPPIQAKLIITEIK